MKAVLDLENGLLAYHLNLLEFCVSVKNKIFRKKETLNCLPIRSQAINIIINNYMNCEIILICDEDNIALAARAIQHLQIFNINISRVEYKNEYIFDSLDELISSDMKYSNIYKTNPSSFIGNAFSFYYYKFICKRDINSRNTFFNGFIAIFWRNLKIILPLLSIWPVLFTVQHVNLKLMNSIYLSSIGFSGIFGILKSLTEINTEWNEFEKGSYPICSDQFVLSNYSILGAFVNMLIYSIFIIGSFNILGLIIGFLFGATYFIFYADRSWKRLIALFLISVLSHCLVSPKFVYLFFNGL
jgi:hypothetical protein